MESPPWWSQENFLLWELEVGQNLESGFTTNRELFAEVPTPSLKEVILGPQESMSRVGLFVVVSLELLSEDRP